MPRWLTCAFSSSEICAKVSEKPSAIKMGSYPKPLLPRGSFVISPFTIPVKRCCSPLRLSAITVLKLALRLVLFFRSSLILLPGLVGTLVYWKQKKLSDAEIAFVKFFLIYSGFFILELLIPSKKLDRYLLPAILSLSLISSIFYYKLVLFINWRKYLYAGLSVYVCLLFVIYSPDYLSYYNPLGGGLAVGVKILEPKWIIGVPETLQYFENLNAQNTFQISDDNESFEEIIDNDKYKTIMSVGFEEKYYTQIWPFFREAGAWAVITDLKPFAIKTRYFVFPIWADRSGEISGLSLNQIGQISVRNVPVYNVYENQNL